MAYGERLRADGMVESFLLTEELAGYVELQEFLRNRFPRGRRRGGRDADLRRIIRHVAEIARRFHAAGYNHRDFYCLPLPRQRARRRAIRHPPDRLATGAAAAVVSSPLDRQGLGPVGLFRPRATASVRKELIAWMRHYLETCEAPPGRQTADPRRDGPREANAASAGGAAMRVGLVVERFDPLRGGLEQWTYRFARKLADRGHEIHVVSREFAEKTRSLPIVAHQVRPVRSPWSSPRRPRRRSSACRWT